MAERAVAELATDGRAKARRRDDAALRPVARTVLRQSVRDALQEAICEGRLRPGEVVAEANLARELGVSRASVREAIRELERQGLVVNFPHRKTVVAAWSEEDIAEVAALRGVLEGFAGRLVARRLSAGQEPTLLAELSGIGRRMRDELGRRNLDGFIRLDLAFHDRLSAACGHRRLIRLLEDLKAQRRAIIAANDLRTLGEPGAWARHDRILRALRSGDGTRVARVIEAHATAGARLLRPSRRAARRPRPA
jgi:DNA-binding GntR family transcriptional regulator